MKINANLVIKGSKVSLVPYKEEHVPTYHDWMQSPYLQELTASEPLTLAEEYEMQQSWHIDENKLTFIIVSPSFNENRVGISSRFGGMIGDVNLFFLSPPPTPPAPSLPELEIMIAEASAQNQGAGIQGSALMMYYAMESLNVVGFRIKIGMKNLPSLRMFTIKFGFVEESRSEIFQEITLVRYRDPKLWTEYCEVNDKLSFDIGVIPEKDRLLAVRSRNLAELLMEFDGKGEHIKFDSSG
ncbi:N-acetyltransferase 9 [Nowakowskiella sp. JEL0407]|nr:N-acetyltransferase 9 [Nowakowskiella sp. JEL0407]